VTSEFTTAAKGVDVHEGLSASPNLCVVCHDGTGSSFLAPHAAPKGTDPDTYATMPCADCHPTPASVPPAPAIR
jgi:hypothetical protein